jgi:Protein of unknown function (DUF2642)
LAEVTDRHLMESLEASFDAAVARREDEAASDLAISLLQGRSLTDIAGREDAWDLRCGDGRRIPVTLIGRDFIGAGTPTSVLVPAARAVLIRAEEPSRPRRSDASLIEELRGLAGLGATVRVDTQSGSFEGLLARAGPDHVLLQATAGEVLVGLEGISVVELTRQSDFL